MKQLDLLSNFMNEEITEISWDSIMPIIERISSPMSLKIYGVYRDIRGEDVQVIIHNAWQTTRYITLKIEYGRRFKEFTEYKSDDETMLNVCYRFVVNFIKWYNQHI
jgi:hypothetical protein